MDDERCRQSRPINIYSSWSCVNITDKSADPAINQFQSCHYVVRHDHFEVHCGTGDYDGRRPGSVSDRQLSHSDL